MTGSGGGGSGHVAPPATATVEEQGVRSGHGLVTISYSPVLSKVPTGSVACPVSGTAKFSKPLTDTASTKAVKVAVELTGSGCDASEVIGGKAPITDVAVKAKLQLAPGATCPSALSNTLKPQKLQVKWQGRNAANKLMTVAVTNTTANPFAYSVFVPLLPLNDPLLTDPKKPFVNDYIQSTLS